MNQMKTHNLHAYKDHISVEGREDYFSWIIEIDEDNKFVVSSCYGQYHGVCIMEGHYHGVFSTLRKALDSIGYERLDRL